MDPIKLDAVDAPPEPTAASALPVVASPLPPPSRVAMIGVPGGIPDLDGDLDALIAANPDMAIRVRVPLYLYDAPNQQYDPWRRVAWVVECREQRLAAAFRTDLDQFVRGWVEAHQ